MVFLAVLCACESSQDDLKPDESCLFYPSQAYRIDGDLVRLKEAEITEDLAEKLIYPLVNEKELATVLINEISTTISCADAQLDNVLYKVDGLGISGDF